MKTKKRRYVTIVVLGLILFLVLPYLLKDGSQSKLAGPYLSEIDYSEIGILGMSQGGWIAPVAACQSDDIDFVATMSGATVTTEEQLVYEEINNIEPYTYKFIAKLIAPVTAHRISKMPHQKALAGFDPIPYWKKISVPVFVGFGGDDKNVPVDKCIKRLKTNKLNEFLVKVYPGGGHAIRNPETNTVSTEYLQDLVSYIENN